MNEKLHEYALLAEVIGALAIVASLIFVGIQINQNSAVVRVSSIQSIRQSMQNVNFLVMENREFAALHSKLFNNEDLDKMEAEQMSSYAVYMIGQSQMAFSQFQNKLINEDDLREMVDPLIFWIERSESIRSIWVNFPNRNDEFFDYMNAILVN